ncbi:SCO3242 family prenyltransferase [Streptomyces sp. NPDC059248]|uniref:SCO3242 family prenyltransferase n=1 Tax=Streptomyces sp. NPDC059248 TaxID=3346791 RepID=UPI003683E5BA
MRSAHSRGARAPVGDRARAWAELLRISAALSVPGDALAGAAARGLRPARGTLLAIGASVCLYEAGMALNDWADRDEDAAERPHRPIPSGRISPAAALGAATALTATGLALAARAGRPAGAVATVLAATVWSYDLHWKHTRFGPAAMAAARALDLLLGATATAPRRPGTGDRAVPGPSAPAGTRPPAGRHSRPASARVPVAFEASGALPVLRAAAVLGAHTYAVTAVSRHEVHGGSVRAPLGALAAVAVIAAAAVREGRPVPTALAAAYARTAVVPYAHAALNPSPPLTERAVGGGIRAVIPLQALLAARAGHPAGTVTGLALTGLIPMARALARRVSPT